MSPSSLPTLLELGRRAFGAKINYLAIQPPLITLQSDLSDALATCSSPDFAAVQAQVPGLIAN